MSTRPFTTLLVLTGFLVGSVFGAVDLFLTWLDPVEDETPLGLLLFYGPMFMSWAIAAYIAAGRGGRFSSGAIGGIFVAFATSIIFVGLNLLRVNLFLDQLVDRVDWQNMMMRFRASGDTLRLFVNSDYIRGAPLKIGAGSALGALMGSAGGAAWWLRHGRKHR